VKDYISKIIDPKLSLNDNKNRIREYIQKYLLYILYKQKLYKNIVFCGGTALRILYDTKRFSEDMDFSLSQNSRDYSFRDLLEVIKKELVLAGYENIVIKFKDKNTVNAAFFKFPSLLYEYELSGHKDENLTIKLDVDTNPPSGGTEKLSLYQSVYMFYILHYDLPSLFAGKMHALLCRKYTKGRDWYDLLWYLSNNKKPEPNFLMLNNAIKQSESGCPEINRNNWKLELKKAVDKVNMEKVRDDVHVFLENPGDIEFLTKENFYSKLKE